jgi:pimeloyl-ACP methyl ester carboxylesterase
MRRFVIHITDMNKIKLLFAMSLLFSVSSNSQSNPYTGIWEGKLKVSVELRLVFHITEDNDHSLFASMDSPDQGAFALPCDTTYVDEKGIHTAIKKLNVSYTGKLVNDTTINGSFSQGISFPMQLKKVERATERNRPQTPKPPFPYDSYELEYDNADRSVRFGATLTVPKTDPNIRYIKAPEWPVAILITGSGQQDRDETLMGHKPFAVIADHLSRNGYAVLRVDDRGTGKTSGDVLNATSADFAKDVEASIEFLKTRKDINKSKIGLIGHSEGGMIAPMIASRRKDINFIILLAGPGIKIIDLMAEQNAAILRSTGVSSKAVQSFIPLFKNISSAIINSSDSTSAMINARTIITSWSIKTPASIRNVLGFKDSSAQFHYITDLYKQMRAPWFHYFMSFDPAPYLQKLSCKVLALNGSKDIQVIASSNLAGIAKNIKRSKVKVFEEKQLPGLNHLFQHCNKCTVQEYAELEETFSPEALSIITDWLNKNVGN